MNTFLWILWGRGHCRSEQFHPDLSAAEARASCQNCQWSRNKELVGWQQNPFYKWVGAVFSSWIPGQSWDVGPGSGPWGSRQAVYPRETLVQWKSKAGFSHLVISNGTGEPRTVLFPWSPPSPASVSLLIMSRTTHGCLSQSPAVGGQSHSDTWPCCSSLPHGHLQTHQVQEEGCPCFWVFAHLTAAEEVVGASEFRPGLETWDNFGVWDTENQKSELSLAYILFSKKHYSWGWNFLF